MLALRLEGAVVGVWGWLWVVVVVVEVARLVMLVLLRWWGRVRSGFGNAAGSPLVVVGWWKRER